MTLANLVYKWLGTKNFGLSTLYNDGVDCLIIYFDKNSFVYVYNDKVDLVIDGTYKHPSSLSATDPEFFVKLEQILSKL